LAFSLIVLHEPNQFSLRFAQPPKAAPLPGAASGGETNPFFTSAETMLPRSNASVLLAELDACLKDHPTTK
jgi:hypothetical protein